MTERGIRFFLFLLCIVPLAGCAAIAPSFVQKPFSDAQVETILSGIQKQHEKVSSFYRMGRVLAKKGLWEQEAHVLIAGTKAPFRIKVELTHPWGQPIAHILVLGNRLEVLSYGEKTIYVSSLPTMIRRPPLGGMQRVSGPSSSGAFRLPESPSDRCVRRKGTSHRNPPLF